MKQSEFLRIVRSVALKKNLAPLVTISQEMRDEAGKLALKASQIVEKSEISDIFATNPETRRGGYLGQMVFHEWFKNDWRIALTYITKELEQMEKSERVDVIDGEINGATIDVKETDLSLPGKFLAWDPSYPFGLQVPEKQFGRKQYNAYVWVVLLPLEKAEKYGHDAAILGYALKEEVAETKAKRYGKHRTLNRSIHYRKLHPMRWFAPEIWNSDLAKQSSLGRMLNTN